MQGMFAKTFTWQRNQSIAAFVPSVLTMMIRLTNY
jgi:hypothetical protein